MKTKPIRVDEEFAKELKKIWKERVVAGKEDKRILVKGKAVSLSRITKAIKRHPYWNKIKQDIINAELEDK